MRISVIVRCYNEKEHIARLLDGIAQQTLRASEIIIVDSGSTDGTLSVVLRHPVRILSIEPEEFSFGRSLNIGCRAAQGDVLVIASAHVYPVYKDWLAQLVGPFSDPQTALVYGKQQGNEVAKYSEHQIFAKWYPETSNLNQDHPFCNNANAAIRRSVWERLPYDETLTGLEDIDWAKRAASLGHKIAYVADAEVVHVHNESLSRVYNRYRREAIALKRIFPQEHFSLWDFSRLYLANFIADCYHAWCDRVLFRNLSSVLGFRLMQFWGTYRGFAQGSLVTSQLRRKFYYPNGWRRSDAGPAKLALEREVDYKPKEVGE